MAADAARDETGRSRGRVREGCSWRCRCVGWRVVKVPRSARVASRQQCEVEGARAVRRRRESFGSLAAEQHPSRLCPCPAPAPEPPAMLATRQALRLSANKQLSPSLTASARSCALAASHRLVRRPAERHPGPTAGLLGTNEPERQADTFCPSIRPCPSTVAVAARPSALPKAAALRAVAPCAAVLGRARASSFHLFRTVRS